MQEYGQLQTQSQGLSQAQQESLRLLQYSTQELCAFLQRELQENPLLDTDRDDFLYPNESRVQAPIDAAACPIDWQQEIREQLFTAHPDPIQLQTAQALIALLTDHGFLPYDQ